MKKNILFHKFFTLISVIMVVSCFGINGNDNKMTTIVLTNLSCEYCYDEVSEIIQSIEDIESCEYNISNDKTVMILNITYNNKITADHIHTIVASNGYNVELLNSKK